MIKGLTQVPWERVDVSFQKSRQRFIAHNTIQASSDLSLTIHHKQQFILLHILIHLGHYFGVICNTYCVHFFFKTFCPLTDRWSLTLSGHFFPLLYGIILMLIHFGGRLFTKHFVNSQVVIIECSNALLTPDFYVFVCRLRGIG